MGKASRFLKAEATTDCFWRLRDTALTPKQWRDREFVNRFCAFRLLLSLDVYRDMDEFLAVVFAR